MYEMDLVVNIILNLSPESYIRIIVKETSCLLANDIIAIQYISKEIFSNLVISYLRPRPYIN